MMGDDLMPVPSFEFDFAAFEVAAKARHEAGKALCSRDGRFIGSSLGAWLEHVRAAGIAHVPATVVASVSRATFLRFEEPEAGDAAAWEHLREALAALPAGTMARWDQCGSLELKGAMAEGRLPSTAEATFLEPFDPRAYDLALVYPGDTIDVHARPWVTARSVDGYPLEFRAFIQDGRVIGVASYYPQRPLPATPEMLGLAESVRLAAARLVEHLDSVGARPWMPSFGDYFAESAVSATIDFLVSESGELLFLEAGPPFGAGAHPCAFIDRPVKGVALALAPGVALR